MEIIYKTKEKSKEEHIYSLIIRLTKTDFNDDKIKELVLKIKVPSFLNWDSEKIKKKPETIKGNEHTVFEIRRKNSLYPQDTPFEIIGPESDIGEILYSVTDDNHYSYLKGHLLLWELYGEGVISQGGNRQLEELQHF